jgi:phenylalanine-4-hydroxylase
MHSLVVVTASNGCWAIAGGGGAKAHVSLGLTSRLNGDPLDGAHFVDQRHSSYASAAHDVWREVLARNAALIERYRERMHPAYVGGMRALALPTEVPRIEDLNERLVPTGWKTVCVDGYIPTSAYVGLMSESIFPISRTVRRAEHIDFAPEPDLVHDVLGHLPMLFCAEYRA